MDFVRNLTKDEAGLIEKIAPFVLVDFVARDQDATLESAGVSFSMLLELQDLGMLSGVEALGLSLTFPSASKDRFVKAFLCHGRGLLVEHDDTKKPLSLGAYVVTTLGRQVIKLGKFIPNESYLLAIGGAIQKSGFKVSLIDYSDAGNGMIRYSNAQEIPNAQQDETQQPPLAAVSASSPVT